MLTQKDIKNIEKHQNVILTTSNKCGQPRSIVVMPSRIQKNEIIISNIQMEKTINNIKENNKVFINVHFPEQDDLQYKIEGVAQIIDNGSLFQEVKEFEEKNNLTQDLKVHSIIVIHIKNFEKTNG